MRNERNPSYVASWGCLGTGMIVFGIWFVWLLRAVDGTDYEYEYASEALVGGGVVILLALIASRLRR